MHGSDGYIVEEHPLPIIIFVIVVLLVGFWLARRQ
jgi:ribose/xylose/arabinose/galactoside ABC-type transport system permease subunit